ncbi:MAG TPA: hypothetical protein VF599_00795 [Pyrinomonadaceae bacterium]
MEARSDENAFVTNIEQAKIDSRITYPCYKSFDEFIDVARLRALNDYIIERINLHIKAEKDDYFLNLHRLDEEMPYQPGVREIWLTRTKPGTPYDYLDLDKSGLWERTEAAEEFADLMDFTETLPFKETGRMLIIYDNAGKEVPPHRDHLNPEICNEFVWFRTNLVKPFYVLNHLNGERKYIESYSAWFDAVNQFHGSEAAEGLSFSIRVDGKFTDEFREKIPQPEFNLASTPALWSCLETQKG